MTWMAMKVTARCQDRHRHQEFLVFLRQVTRAYPDVAPTWCWTTTPRTNTRRSRSGSRRTRACTSTSPHARIVDEHGRDLVLHGRTASHPPRLLPLRPRRHTSGPDLHRRLERPRPRFRSSEVGRVGLEPTTDGL